MQRLYLTKSELPGNLAKLKIIIELSKYIEEGNELKIIDIGCAGLLPFNLWEYLLESYQNRFQLYGIDILGVERASAICKDKGWKNVNLKKANAYKLNEEFDKNYFDITVSIQVLEHVRYPKCFLFEIKNIVRQDGLIYLAFDSAHYIRKKNIKEYIKNFLSIIGPERFHFKPLYDYQLEPMFKDLELTILEKRFYNVHPLKEIHNHKISKDKKNNLLFKWYDYEEYLNKDEDFIRENKRYFRRIYYKLQK